VRCGICGSEEGTAGCPTAWKHASGYTAFPVTFVTGKIRDECEHGSLRRSCLACETASELRRLAAEVEVARRYEAEVVRLSDFVNACVKGGADWMEKCRAAEDEVAVLRTALGEASDMCAQEYSVDNQRSMDRVMKILSLALHPARAALAPKESKP
jgi:hypothetical protein